VEKVERQQPKSEQSGIGHDKKPGDHGIVKRGIKKDQGNHGGFIVGYPPHEAIHEDVVDDGKNDRPQPHEKIVVPLHIASKQLYNPAHHRRVVKMAQCRIKGIGVIIHLIVGQWQYGGKPKFYRHKSKNYRPRPQGNPFNAFDHFP